MKTFRTFLLEATIQQLRAQANAARQRGDWAEFNRIQVEAGKLEAGTQAKIGAALNKGKKKPETNQNTWVSGRASKPETPVSSVGTTSKHTRGIVNRRTNQYIGPSDPKDVRVSWS